MLDLIIDSNRPVGEIHNIELCTSENTFNA